MRRTRTDSGGSTVNTERGVPRRPGDIRNTPPHGIPAKATPVEGTPIHPGRPGAQPGAPPGAPIPPGAPTHPIVQAPPGPQAQAEPEQPPPGRPATGPQARVGEASGGWGRPAVEEPEGAWSGAPGASDPYLMQDEQSSASGLPRVRATSGVQVRLGARERDRGRRRSPRKARTSVGRRGGLAAAGVLVLAGLVTIGIVLTRGAGDGGTGAEPSAAGATPDGTGAPLPRAGSPIEVGTADGSKYRLAAVTGGVSDGVVTTFQSSPPSGTAFAYIEYLLTNPTGHKVLLDFPGDVFVRRDLVTPDARGRCMPQAGVPEEMCTPPTNSQVVRRIRGGALIPGDGGDKFMAPGGTYLVRATVDVPVQRKITRRDMGLYVWKQLYMADQLAEQAPFPR